MKFYVLALAMLLGACTTLPEAQTGTLARPSVTSPLWVDTDLACEVGLLLADPDDCLAVILLLRAQAAVVGVSTTAGNASDLVAKQLAKRLVGQIPIYEGSNSCDSPLLTGFIEATKHRRVTVLAIGPLTNIAKILRCRPALAMQIKEVVFVGGRRPGQNLIANTSWPWTIPLRDLNVELDLEAVRLVISTGVPLRLIPFEAGKAAQLGLWTTNFIGPLPDYLTRRLQEWSLMSSLFWGSDGIMPFDPVAAVYTLWPEIFQCKRVSLTINEGKLVARDDPKAAATYCTPSDPKKIKSLLLKLILQK